MKVNHKLIITILKTVTIVGFFIALAYKLYNLYTYGGTTKPTPSNDNYDNEDENEVTEKYDEDDYSGYPEAEYPDVSETKEPYDG